MTRLLHDYLLERVRPLVFVPVVTGLWSAALWVSGGAAEAGNRGLTLLLVTLMVLQFRLWDDLEDLDRDRRVHPHRVLARAGAGPFRWLLAGLVTASAAIGAAAGPPAAVAVVVLDVVVLAAYRLVRPCVPDVIWRFPLLLAKYPAFVLIAALASGRPSAGRLAVAMMAAMTAACVYEALHDGRRPMGVTP